MVAKREEGIFMVASSSANKLSVSAGGTSVAVELESPDNDGRSIGHIVAKIMDNISSKPPYAAIFSDWRRIVGNSYSSIVAPHRIICGKSSGRTLVLRCKKGFAITIQHESEHIMNLINDFFGKKYFLRIQVIQMDYVS
ncbi:MAG: DciA family protein [Holosporaceae bacterium]|jgi:hypothetical protein|nr:DciA family protein [Holosporaceae bacterium]